MPNTPKKIPERRCVGCGNSFPKKTLLRVVRQKDGHTVLDATGKLGGRGAYLCRSRECFIKARKAKRFERNLECTISDEVYDALDAELRGMTDESD